MDVFLTLCVAQLISFKKFFMEYPQVVGKLKFSVCNNDIFNYYTMWYCSKGTTFLSQNTSKPFKNKVSVNNWFLSK